MAELQVGVRADQSGIKKAARSFKVIQREADKTATSLQRTSAAAAKTGIALKTTVSASGQLATTQNLAATANVAVARTLNAVAAGATKTATAEATAVVETNRLTAAFARMSAVGSGAFLKMSAGAKRFTTQARTAAGSMVGMSVAAQGLGALIAVGLGVGIKSAVELETTFSRIEGLVGIAASEVEAFKKPLNDIAKATAKGPNELAEALFFITSAGFEGQEALDVLEASARAAAAGLGETKNVADAVTSAVNAYGIENLNAAKATDILVATVREGKAEASSIAGALGQILPVAAELGIEFEELGGTIAALTRIGLGADQASTALGATMSALQKITPDAEKALNEFGLTGSGLRKTIRDEGLLVGLQQMNDAFGDNETALIRVIPNIRALRAVLPLVGKNAGDVAKIFEEVADSAGAADDAFEVYEKTTSFTLNQSLVVLQTTLIKLGNTILPAVTKAFVNFASAIESVVDGFDAFGQNVAEFFVGADDPIQRAKDQLVEVRQSLENLNDEGLEGWQKSANAAINDFVGLNVANIELEGSLENQVKLLKGEEARLEAAIVLNEELLAFKEKQTAEAEDAAVAAEKEAAATTAIVIDQKLLDKSTKSLKDLREEVTFLRAEATNLQELGEEGIGLAEDFQFTSTVARGLQGDIAADAKVIRELVNEKRRLEEVIDDVSEAFTKQDTATDFLEDLATDTALLQQKFEALAGGEALFDIDSLQKAQQIFNDLGTDAQEGTSVEGIQQQIQVQNALNTAIAAMPVDKFAELKTEVELLQELNIDPESSYFGQLGPQIQAVGDAAVDAVLKAQGLQGLDQILLDAMPKEQQFMEAHDRLKAAFDLKGIVDPETNPEFILALEALREKIFSVGDATKEFAIQAARNLQSAFADFLFDPFSDGLDGMLRNFADTLKRMAAEALSQQLLSSLFSSLGASNTGGILSAIGGAIGGAADGGRIPGNKPTLVGERGPELFQPGQSGNIVSNEMMRGNAQAAPTVNVSPAPVVVVDDPSKVEKALQSANGQRALVNAITEKRGSVNQALGRG